MNFTAICSITAYNNLRCGILNSSGKGGFNMVYQRIRDLREDADLKQSVIAKYLHCSQQVYSNYELGQRDIPTAVLIALAEFHNTNVDYLLGLTAVRAHYSELQPPAE